MLHKIKRPISKVSQILLFTVIFLFCGFRSFAQTYYWEYPKAISTGEAWFPVTVNSGNDTYIFWQDVDVSNNQIWLSARHYVNEKNYTDSIRFAGPFKYSGEVPDIYTVSAGKDGKLVILAISDIAKMTAYTSTNKAKSFTQKSFATNDTLVAPRVYTAADGTYRLFISQIDNDSFYIYTSESSDGLTWGNFEKFSPSAAMKNPFIPVMTSDGGTDSVVFQAQYSDPATQRLSYQLYITSTKDGGKNWSEPKMITNQASMPSGSRRSFAQYWNQRASLYRFKNKLYLAWERRATESVSSTIWTAEITEDGLVPNTAAEVSNKGNASRPVFFEYKNSLFLEWFDTRSGKESIYMAEKIGKDWDTYTLVENKYSNMFSYPLLITKTNGSKQLSFVWQQNNSKRNTLCVLLPDTTVEPPILKAVSYKEGKRSNAESVQLSITFPDDSSGIAGYSYTWGKDNTTEPPEKIQYYTRNRTINVKADGDGIYTLIARVQDKAGNWSDVSKITYHRDLTPPQAPELNVPELDKYGFIASNNFKVDWNKSPDEDVAGYNYQLDYLGNISGNLAVNKTHTIRMSQEAVQKQLEDLAQKYDAKLSKKSVIGGPVQTYSTVSKTYNNRSNGVYLFSVSAVDEVGNVSEASKILLFMNKFRPSTFITSAREKANESGELELVIEGGGFTYEGSISEIYIDRDGKAPYDLTLTRSKGQYKVVSDSKITNVQIGTELDEGTYRIGLVHTDRGLYFTNSILKISQTGTLKIESEYVYHPRYTAVFRNIKSITIGRIITIVLCVLVLIILLALFFVLNQNRKEKKLIQMEIDALKKGEPMPLRSRKTASAKETQRSLRGKLVVFTVVLVTLVILIVTVQNGLNMITTQGQTLVDGLQNRIDVLTGSLSTGVRNFMPVENDLELGSLPAQKDAVTEAKFVTILGEKREELQKTEEDKELKYVWATNDKEIYDKSQNFSDHGILQGQTQITEETTLNIISRFNGLNETTAKLVEEQSKQITAFSQEYSEIALKTDEESRKRQEELSEITTNLRTELDNTLSKISVQNSGSYPVLPSSGIELLRSENDTYLFYKPVLYRSGNSNNYLHGVILVEVSVENQINELMLDIKSILRSGILLAIIAIIIGSVGAWVLAGVIVRPIKAFESHLVRVGILMAKPAGIRKKLEKDDMQIKIKSKDEIGHLGNVLNEMTRTAGAAAREEELLYDGGKVQNCFIPLEAGRVKKLPFARLEEEKLQMYAFYKGDSAVSGDYFDYKKLDENWYAFIKCDISGHGVPAALLVSVVATKFKDFYYFSNWDYKKQGINLKAFVTAVNDFIFELGTQGKFSTINISLYNKNTGELYISNAGDNKIHIFESSTKRLKEITLANTPTAGGFSTDMVDMRGGFKVEKILLNPGDVLYLYTDGIDEAERKLRDSLFAIQTTTVEEERFNRETKQTEKVKRIEELKEQFGQERINEVIEAVMNRKNFVLKRDQDPSKDYLEFDFTSCQGTIEESIVALAAVERVFRMVKTPTVRVDNEIEIDAPLDEFLKEHFKLYTKYCVPLQATAADDERLKDPNTIVYTNVIEDHQADDITLIAIKRK